METYHYIISLIDNHLIRGIFIGVLFIVLVRKFFKKLDTEIAISIIKWLLIIYSTGVVLSYLLLFLFSDSSDHSNFLNRLTGRYRFAYWLMLAASILPLILVFKKVNNKIYFVLILTILMNFGWLFESFVIHVTSMHGDYSNQVGYHDYFPFNHELIIILKGLILGIITLVIGHLISLRREGRR